MPALPSSIFSSAAGAGAGGGARGGDVLELGARLLGDVHSARVLLHCEAQHAAFFVITEDAWLAFCLDVSASTLFTTHRKIRNIIFLYRSEKNGILQELLYYPFVRLYTIRLLT